MYFTVTPVSERQSIAWTYVAMDYGHLPEDEIRKFEDEITWQDGSSPNDIGGKIQNALIFDTIQREVLSK